MAATYKRQTNEEQDRANALIGEFETLKNNKSTLNSHCREIAERILPDDKYLFDDFNSDQSPYNMGDKRNQEIYDSTGVIALQKFAAIVDSLLTPRSSFYHQLRTNNKTLEKNKAVNDYFQEVNEILFEERYAPTANFPAQNFKGNLSIGAYGTSTLFIDDLYGARGIRYRDIHLSQVYLRQNHQGMVDGLCLYFPLTARQAMKQFKAENLPECIVKAAETTPEKTFYFLHWVVSKDEYDPQLAGYKGMPYASYYISMAERCLITEGGYNTFPYCVKRYRLSSNDPFGRSIGMDCLPSIKTSNEQKKTLLKAGHLATDPIILAHDDSVVDLYDGVPGSMIPGGVNKDGRPLVHTLPFGRVDIGKEALEMEQRLINESFLITLFQILVETPEMSATEVLERAREKGILLAPTIGALQADMGSMIDREIDILSRQGRLPPMPQILREAQGEYKIVYDSPLNRTQKSEWAAGAMRTVEQLIMVAQATGNPEPLDYINWNVAAPQIADINGTPSTWINDPEKIRMIRAARAEQVQQQRQMEAAPAMAGMMKAVK